MPEDRDYLLQREEYAKFSEVDLGPNPNITPKYNPCIPFKGIASGLLCMLKLPDLAILR